MKAMIHDLKQLGEHMNKPQPVSTTIPKSAILEVGGRIATALERLVDILEKSERTASYEEVSPTPRRIIAKNNPLYYVENMDELDGILRKFIEFHRVMGETRFTSFKFLGYLRTAKNIEGKPPINLSKYLSSEKCAEMGIRKTVNTPKCRRFIIL